ncbi:hypothetical protein Y032_0016g3073 [Ancylostoma ceylanicum]|uniref:Uncharacterized protein n=1 Tax=Ancylostoma ceylanicum TaxID=53326 RepID=A0A016V6F3_9BILA|nr:hypothetical protein Y032_0016g3073 [Ancylostoma ceylanicum]
MPGDRSNKVIRVRRRPKLGESLETGPTVELEMLATESEETPGVQWSYTRKDVVRLLHSCGKGASEPESSKVQKTRLDK